MRYRRGTGVDTGMVWARPRNVVTWPWWLVSVSGLVMTFGAAVALFGMAAR